MKRSLAALLLAVALPACRTGAPKPAPGAAAPPDLLRPFVGELRVLRHRGEERALMLGPRERLAGECDVAVRVRTAAFDKGTARFSLDTLGLPNVGGRDAKCKQVHPGSHLALTGFAASPAAAEVAARVDEVLQAPEAYLKAKGVAFDLAPGEPPVEVASQQVDASSDERVLALKVSLWPKKLLSVNAWYHDLSGRVRQEGEVEFDAVVGTDGRLYRPRIKGGLGDAHQNAVLAALSFWRFEPARRGEAPVAARIALRGVLKVY